MNTMHHELKLWPVFYERTLAGEKMFEVRHNDRGYQKNDTVTLLEFDPQAKEAAPNVVPGPVGYTGRQIGPFVITYVMPIDGERVVFGMRLL